MNASIPKKRTLYFWAILIGFIYGMIISFLQELELFYWETGLQNFAAVAWGRPTLDHSVDFLSVLFFTPLSLAIITFPLCLFFFFPVRMCKGRSAETSLFRLTMVAYFFAMTSGYTIGLGFILEVVAWIAALSVVLSSRSNSSESSPPQNLAQELEKLHELKVQGILSEEEFQTQKIKLLSE